jgi:dTDP-L-rhamnose 4-epimerase
VREVAVLLAEMLGRPHLEPLITGRHRVGDIRHCFADTDRAGAVLGYAPAVRFQDGLAELAAWLEGQQPEDRLDRAHAELEMRGLAL